MLQVHPRAAWRYWSLRELSVRERSLASWAGDLAALTSHLGLDRFALAGESGGGPFTLAAAHRLSGRVSVAACGTPGEGGGPEPVKSAFRVSIWSEAFVAEVRRLK